MKPGECYEETQESDVAPKTSWVRNVPCFSKLKMQLQNRFPRIAQFFVKIAMVRSFLRENVKPWSVKTLV